MSRASNAVCNPLAPQSGPPPTETRTGQVGGAPKGLRTAETHAPQRRSQRANRTFALEKKKDNSWK